jgi:hypothetical protein
MDGGWTQNTFPLGSRSPQLTTTMVSLLDQGFQIMDHMTGNNKAEGHL